jgi:anti-sigma factor RsiW
MMTCVEFEILITDYLDGTLPAAEQVGLEQHLSGCAGCRTLADEISSALKVLGQAEQIEVPADLITRIAYQAPLGRVRDPFEHQGAFSRWITRWLQPVLQPRLVMGMAMTVLSFAMLERCTGVKVQHIQAADLSPVRIWGGVEDKTLRVKDRAVKYYENLRWVYEIEVRLRAMQDQQAAEAEAEHRPATQQQSDRNGEKK